MSRIGKLPITIPAGVKVSIDGNNVSVEGPKGKLQKSFNSSVVISMEDGTITVAPRDNSRLARALHGTIRSIVDGMVQGAAEGFSKDLEISGVGFQANLKGTTLNLKLGFSHDINYQIPAGITVAVDGNTKLKVSGADKQMVGQVAASIKKFAPVEPYKGKGVRIIGEYVIRKEGKTVA